jgi:hypothetical protein
MKMKIRRRHGAPGLNQGDLRACFGQLFGEDAARRSRANDANVKHVRTLARLTYAKS